MQYQPPYGPPAVRGDGLNLYLPQSAYGPPAVQGDVGFGERFARCSHGWPVGTLARIPACAGMTGPGALPAGVEGGAGGEDAVSVGEDHAVAQHPAGVTERGDVGAHVAVNDEHVGEMAGRE